MLEFKAARQGVVGAFWMGHGCDDLCLFFAGFKLVVDSYNIYTIKCTNSYFLEGVTYIPTL